MFGTNDAAKWNETQFLLDYTTFLDSLRSLVKPEPEIFVMIPPPCYLRHSKYCHIVNEVLPDVIRKLVENYEGGGVLHLIDIFNRLGGKSLSRFDLFCSVTSCEFQHPNSVGYSEIASEVFKTLFLASEAPSQ